MTGGVLIRPMADDHAAVAELLRACEPSQPVTAEQLRLEDANRRPELRHSAFVAELHGSVVGVARRGNDRYADDPERFVVSLRVHPAVRRKGVGAALAAALHDSLTEVAPCRLMAVIRHSEPEALVMAARLGFRTESISHHARLGPGAADVSGLPQRLAALEAEGITVRTFEQLQLTDGFIRALRDLDAATVADIPSAVPETVAPVQGWRAEFIDAPHVRHDASFVAFHGGAPIALCTHWDHEDGALLIAMTGVDSAHRGRGIATTLKLCGIELAARQGRVLHTYNHAENEPILALNEALGFVRHHSASRMVRELLV